MEVGFRNGSATHCIRRTPYGSADRDISALVDSLVDVEAAPPGALRQVCNATIIRDEHIARLSLDLKDVDRYSILREAIGASDADEWISRSSALLSMASDRTKVTTRELAAATFEVRTGIAELDRVRTQLSESAAFEKAVSALQDLLDSTAPVEEIGDVGRRRLAEIGSLLEVLQRLLDEWQEIDAVRQELPTREPKIKELQSALADSDKELASHVEALQSRTSSSDLSRQASQIQHLVMLGRDIGLHDEHCPLCNSTVDVEQFERGLALALELAKSLDEQAVHQVTREQARDEAMAKVAAARAELEAKVREREEALIQVREYDARLEAVDLLGSRPGAIAERISVLQSEREALSSHIRFLDTMSLI